MDLMTEIDDALAFIRLDGGSYRQVKLYERGGVVYVKHGAGFLRMGVDGATSSPKVKIKEWVTPYGKIERQDAFTMRYVQAQAKRGKVHAVK